MKQKRKGYASQFEKMTTQPVESLVIELGIPTTISMLVTSFYNMADTYFVGQLRDTSASAAVGVVFSFMSILQAVGFLFGQGAGSNISRRLGKKDEASASRFASTSFFTALFIGVGIALFGYLFQDQLLELLGKTDTNGPYAKQYLDLLLWASPFVITSFVLNNILRFEGKARLAMVGLVTGTILNILLDPLLMFVFDLRIGGAALATAISQTISFGVLLSMFLCGRTQSKLALRNMTHDWKDYYEIIATGLPSLVRQGFASASGMVLNHTAKPYGDAAVAAMSIVSRISMMIFSAGLGIGQGFQPVCGYNYGAKEYKRVKKALFFTLKVAMVLMGTCALIGLLVSDQAIAFFRNDPDVIKIGTVAMRFQCFALMVVPIQVIANMALQSSGMKWQATFTSMLRSGLYYIPLLLLLSGWQKLFGIEIAQTVADFASIATTTPFLIHYIWVLNRKEADASSVR